MDSQTPYRRKPNQRQRKKQRNQRNNLNSPDSQTPTGVSTGTTVPADTWASRVSRPYRPPGTGNPGTQQPASIQRQKPSRPSVIIPQQNEPKPQEASKTPGSDILLPFALVLWSHDIGEKRWTINSYHRHLTLKSVADFWRLFNNFPKLGIKFHHFFLMREGIDPTWEHPMNRSGGMCSFRTEISNSAELLEDLAVYAVCEKLVDRMDDINGISISPKNTWAIIKIWNRDASHDLTQTINHDILDKYCDLSIKYKVNAPEY